MQLHAKIKLHIATYLLKNNCTILEEEVLLTPTRKEFEGDITCVVFQFSKLMKQKPESVAKSIGEYLVDAIDELESFTVIQGFLNLTLKDEFWLAQFETISAATNFGQLPKQEATIMIEYCGPNTNKPLHLGHLRNVVLGFSMIRIKEAAGYKVIKANIINDRGVHICKSMYAWMHYGNGETPENTGIKGDHLVGKYYVLFDKKLKEEMADLIAKGSDKETAKKKSTLLLAIQNMLNDWEMGDAEVLSVWKMMNSWVLKGFEETYKNIGIHFDVSYFESENYLFGKQLIEEGLQQGIFFKKDNNSIWVDLTAEKLDEKLLLRGDGTSVYITQDIGVAVKRFDDYAALKGITYTVGNEQEYHFKVLKNVLKKMGKPYWEGIYHLSYGMVNLPEGKMKSREGTVVDADDLLMQMKNDVVEMMQNAGKSTDWGQEALIEISRIVSLGALKYFLLKVKSTKNIVFNPAESIDLQGNTGPFIQYSYARTRSILRKQNVNEKLEISQRTLTPTERELLVVLCEFENQITLASNENDPAHIANYAYSIARNFNKFYQEESIINAPDNKKMFRLQLTQLASKVLSKSLYLLGIEAPEKM